MFSLILTLDTDLEFYPRYYFNNKDKMISEWYSDKNIVITF